MQMQDTLQQISSNLQILEDQNLVSLKVIGAKNGNYINKKLKRIFNEQRQI